MDYQLTVVSFIQYITHYVADMIHNFPAFLAFMRWGGQAYTDFLKYVPLEVAQISFAGVTSALLVRLVKW